MGTNQTYTLLHSKGKHQQNEKTAYRLGDNIYKCSNWKRLNLQNIQIARNTQ